MFSPLKLLPSPGNTYFPDKAGKCYFLGKNRPGSEICVGLICATAVSANEKTKRDVTDLLSTLPQQWLLQNNDLGLRTYLSRVSTPDFKILRIDSYGQDKNGRQPEDSVQSIGGNSPQQSSVSAENSEEQYTNENNELQQENRNALSSSTGGQWNSGRSNGQRQSQISGGLRNSLRGNFGRTSIGSNQIPLWRSYSSNNNQQRESGIRNGGSQDDQRLEQQRRGQVWTSELELNNDETNSRLLGEQRLGKISRGNILQGNLNIDSQNSQGVESDIQRDIPSGFTSKNSRFGGQNGRDSNGQSQGIQELRRDNIGRQQLNQIRWNRQRLPLTRNWNGNNIASRQEGLDQRNEEGRTTSGNILNDNQRQTDRDQNNISVQRPNTYTYGELSARILKVIQSNPSMMNALMQELGNDGESRNQQVGQLKSLLQEIGQFGENASSVGENGRGQQNSLIRNLLEIMERSINNQKRSNIPTY